MEQPPSKWSEILSGLKDVEEAAHEILVEHELEQADQLDGEIREAHEQELEATAASVTILTTLGRMQTLVQAWQAVIEHDCDGGKRILVEFLNTLFAEVYPEYIAAKRLAMGLDPYSYLGGEEHE